MAADSRKIQQASGEVEIVDNFSEKRKEFKVIYNVMFYTAFIVLVASYFVLSDSDSRYYGFVVVTIGLTVFWMSFYRYLRQDRILALDRCLQVADELGIELTVDQAVGLTVRMNYADEIYKHFVDNLLPNSLDNVKHPFFGGVSLNVKPKKYEEFVIYLHVFSNNFRSMIEEVEEEQPLEGGNGKD